MKSIQQIIDDQLNTEQQERGKRERSGLWNPSMFGNCFRRQWYNRKNIPPSEPFDSRTLRVFKCGYLFESFASNLYLAQNPKAQTQVLVKTEDVCGYADLVEDDIVSDFKSQHSKSFWWMLKSKDIRQDKKNNWLQVMYYAWKLNKPKGRLCFISKDDLCIQEYYQDFEDGYWLEELSKELKNLSDVWKEEVLPEGKPRIYGGGEKGKGKECEYCNWKTTCLKEKDETTNAE
jgi:hypothetical protein